MFGSGRSCKKRTDLGTMDFDVEEAEHETRLMIVYCATIETKKRKAYIPSCTSTVHTILLSSGPRGL